MGAAQPLQVTKDFNQPVVSPGGSLTVGGFTVTNPGNSSVNVTDIVTNQLPFNVSYHPNSGIVKNQSNRTFNATVSVPDGFEPGEYQAGIVFVFENRSSIQRSFTVRVPEERNWTISNASVKQNVSVGSSGRLGTITLSNSGNARVDLETVTSGRLAEYIVVNQFISSYPGLEKQVVLEYRIPKTTPFGRYNGTITLTDRNGVNRSVNVSTRFRDVIDPQVSALQLSDMMATTTQSIRVAASDNIGVSNISVNVTRQASETQGNTTVLVNRSVVVAELEHQPNSNLWTYEFKQSSEIGQYFARFVVTDEAGNTVILNRSFQVKGLDATQVLEPNFQFTSIRQGNEGEKVVIQNEIKSPFTLELERFAYAGNATIQVGVRPPGASSPEFFDAEGSTLEFEKQGEYTLVIDSRGEEKEQGIYDFDGRLTISVPKQHFNVSDIVFSGKVNSDDYPDPQETLMEEFRGYIGYGNVVEEFEKRYGTVGNDDSREYAYFIGRIPAEQCRGSSSWGDCTSFTMGTIEDVTEENDRMRRERNVAIAVAILSVFSVGLYLRKERLRGTLHAYVPTKVNYDG